MKAVLLVVYIGSHFVELIRVGRLLKRSGRYTPVFLFEWRYPTVEQDLAACQSEGFEFLAPPPFPPLYAAGVRPSLGARVRFWIRELYYTNHWIRFLIGLPREAMRLRRRYLEIRKLVVRRQVAAIILPEDNVEFGTPVHVKAAHAVGVPSVIVPFTVANALEPAENLFHRPEYGASTHPIHRVVSRLYPRWKYTHRGRQMIRLEPHRILATEWLGLTPPMPWIINSGSADAIAVESEFMRQYYLREGLPAEQLVMTGTLTDDILSEGLGQAGVRRLALCQELGLSPNKPLLLCALPPNQFPRPCEFQDYDELVAFWGRSLAAVRGWNVIIRPHPRHRREELRALESPGVAITWGDTATLVPLCDLFVACASATIRWAIACGKPVLNFDAYQMNLDDYSEFPGVVAAHGRREFTAMLRRLTEDTEYYAAVTARQRQRMEFAGTLDGQAAHRMLGLLDRLAVCPDSTGGRAMP